MVSPVKTVVLAPGAVGRQIKDFAGTEPLDRTSEDDLLASALRLPALLRRGGAGPDQRLALVQ